MLGPGDRIPPARVWNAAGAEPVVLAEAIGGDGLVCLCFYPFDWSGG